MASIAQRPDGVWRARYRDGSGKEHARHFKLKRDAQRWLDEETAKLVTGTWTTPGTAKMTVSEWCDTWIAGYTGNRPSTISQARVHLKRIRARFGTHLIGSVRPSDVRTWMSELQAEGLATNTRKALHSRLGQIFSDAVHDGIIPRSPVSRRTAPGQGEQRAYVATTAQVWALHDALPEHARGIVLLGAFAGLRRNEIIALRVQDVDFMRGIITPAVQYGGLPLKTEESRNPIPIPPEMAIALGRNPAAFGSDLIVTTEHGRQVSPGRANDLFNDARAKVTGLPDDFRLHDLRHYFASLLIAAGLDIKTVQARLRHASAKTTLDVYGHLWPDRDESSRAAVAAVFEARSGDPADGLRTQGG